MRTTGTHLRSLARVTRDLGISVRLTSLTLPPVLAVLALATLFLHEQHDQARGFQHVAELSALTSSISGLIHELQRERGGTVLLLNTNGELSRARMLRTQTDLKLPPVLVRHGSDFIDPGSNLQAKLRVAQAALSRLEPVRARIDRLVMPAPEVSAYFTQTISDLLGVVLETGASVQDTAAARTFIALYNLMQGKERAGQERASGAQGFAAGRFSPKLLNTFLALRDQQENFFHTFEAFATMEQQAVLRTRLEAPINAEILRMRRVAAQGAPGGTIDGVDAHAWFTAATERINLLHEVEVDLADGLQANAGRQAHLARRWFDACLAAMALLVAAIGVACVAIGRSLSRPLQRMTAAMTALASGDTGVSLPQSGRRDEVGRMGAAVEVFRANAVARLAREGQIQHMARHDALTDLPNRVMFKERLDYAMALVGRGSVAAVFSIDLDDFTAINDSLGHIAGDQYLRVIADRLQFCVRETDLVARLGGDEFAIVQMGMRHGDDAPLLAERLLHVVGGKLDLAGQSFMPRLSIGVVVAPSDGADADELMRRVEVALGRAKADGGHAIRFFEPGMEARQQAARRLKADLQRAVAAEEFELFYQPLVDATTSAIMGFEALVRWAHPELGRVSPATFIPVAEETGLIIPLGAWIMRQACADAASWSEPLSVAVNLSAVQFKDAKLLETITGALADSGLPATRLELEITESLLLRDDVATLETLHALTGLGVRISMDDFGTGYSSLSYLSSFPFDKIKIDQSFIRNLGMSEGAEAIVRAIVTLGKSLGMVVTAEGVETEAQRAQLRMEGCMQLQGYLFSRPQPAAEIEALIHAQYRPESQPQLAET